MKLKEALFSKATHFCAFFRTNFLTTSKLIKRHYKLIVIRLTNYQINFFFCWKVHQKRAKWTNNCRALYYKSDNGLLSLRVWTEISWRKFTHIVYALSVVFHLIYCKVQKSIVINEWTKFIRVCMFYWINKSLVSLNQWLWQTNVCLSNSWAVKPEFKFRWLAHLVYY